MAVAPESWPSPLQRLIRTSNKYLLNPLMLRLAGKRFWYASVVEHVGRRSGKRFSTPVVADRVGDDLYIPLPYGTQVDWVRNIPTAGRATVNDTFSMYGRIPSYRATLDRGGAAEPADVAVIGDAATIAAGVEAYAAVGVTDFAAVVPPGAATTAATTELLAELARPRG